MATSARLYSWIAGSVVTMMETHKASDHSVIALMAILLADDFEHDNPRFDRQRFYAACGLSEIGQPK